MRNILSFIVLIFLLTFSTSRLFAQPIMVMKPSNDCTQCDTLRLQKGKPTVIFVHIVGDGIPIEEAGGSGILYREWKELNSAFEGEVRIEYMNKYGSLVLGDSKVYDFRDKHQYYRNVYYWDGNVPVKIEPLKGSIYLTEQVALLVRKKAVSSYRKAFERDSLLYHNLILSNSPSKELIANLKYSNEFNEEGMEYFPYQLLDLTGLKGVEMSADPLFKDKGFRVSINSQQMIGKMVNFRKGEEDNLKNFYEYKNGLLDKSKYEKYAYKGDTLICYTDSYATLSVLKNKMFIPLIYYRINNENKTFEKTVYAINENEDGSLTIQSDNGHKVFYSNTTWKLPLKIGDGAYNLFSFMNDRQTHIKCDSYISGELTETVVYEMDNGKIKSAEIWNYQKDYTFNLYYRYSYY